VGVVPADVCVKLLQVPAAMPMIAAFTQRGAEVGDTFVRRTVVGGLNTVRTTCIFEIRKLWVLAMLPCSYNRGNKFL